MSKYMVLRGFHGKRGVPILIVKLMDRYPPDSFRSLKRKAKQIGGNYSRQSEGFIFETHEAVNLFLKELS